MDRKTGSFRLDKPSLVPGLYFVVANGIRIFDFLVTGRTNAFRLRGSMERLDSLIADGSAKNSAFFQFERKRKAVEARMTAKRAMYEVVQKATKNDPKALRRSKKRTGNCPKSGSKWKMPSLSSNGSRFSQLGAETEESVLD